MRLRVLASCCGHFHKYLSKEERSWLILLEGPPFTYKMIPPHKDVDAKLGGLGLTILNGVMK